MKQLITFFINVFNSSRISLSRLIAFSSDNVQRMIAKNDSGEFTERIAATSAALSNLLELTTDDEILLGRRKGAKQEKEAFRAELPARIRPVAAALVAEYGDPSPELTEALPQGRSIFARATDDRLIVHLNTLLNAVTDHQVDLGMTVVDTVADLRDEWVAIYSASEVSTGLKADGEADVRTARTQLQKELFTNLQELALMFPDQPEKLGLFMQQHLLDGRASIQTAGGNPNESSSAGSTGSGSSSIGSSSFGSSSASVSSSSSSVGSMSSGSSSSATSTSQSSSSSAG